MAMTLALQSIADPSMWAEWERLGLIAYLLLTIVFGFTALSRDWIYTRGRVQDIIAGKDAEVLAKDGEIADLKEEISIERRVNDTLRAENAQQNRDIVRLTDEYKNITLRIIAQVIGGNGGGGRKDV